jgi:hypothetical protein
MTFISINPEEAKKYVSSVSEYATLINKEGKKFTIRAKGITIPSPRWRPQQSPPALLLMFL